MDTAPRARLPRAASAVLAAAVALVGGALFAGGNSGTSSTGRLGTVAVFAAAGIVVAWSRGKVVLPRLDRAGGVAAGTAMGLVAWTGLSIWWSIAGDRSWDSLAKAFVLLAFGVVGLAAAALPGRPLRRLGLSVAALLGAVLVWALLGKVIPALGPDDAGRVARLKGSVGYWNALALLADAALGLGLWLVASTVGRLARPVGALLLYAATIVILLTQSRAGLLAGLVVVALSLWLTEERVEAAMFALLSVGPGVVVAGWAFTRPALVEDGGARLDRVADGGLLGALIVVGALVVVGLIAAVPVRRLAVEHRREVVRVLAGSVALLVVVGLVGLVASVGNPVTWARNQIGSTGEVANDPGRFTNLESNNRTVWWGEAWQVFRASPAGGSGAGTFEIARKRYRDSGANVTEPHSVPLQLLSETGLPGFALGTLLMIALCTGLRSMLHRVEPEERAAAVGLLALPAAFGLHALVDFDLDFLAVAAPTVLATAALLGAARPAWAARGGMFVPLAAGLGAAATIWILVAPALSSRALDTAYRHADAGDLGTAAASARRAQSLNPLSPEPLFARSEIADQTGDRSAAEDFLVQATVLQPENPATWYTLGTYRQVALRDQCGAYFAFNAAYTLDPKSTLFFKGGPLDQARQAVDDPVKPACGS